jgi:hypothetical protein
MNHSFNVGQLVELLPMVLRPCAPGPYEIRYLVPISEREPCDPSYRVKSPAEKHDASLPKAISRLLLTDVIETAHGSLSWMSVLATHPLAASFCRSQFFYGGPFGAWHLCFPPTSAEARS